MSAATSVYLFTHPDVNDFMTGLKGLPRDKIRGEIQQYFDAHLQERDEVRAIRAPLVEIRERCGTTAVSPSEDMASQ